MQSNLSLLPYIVCGVVAPVFGRNLWHFLARNCTIRRLAASRNVYCIIRNEFLGPLIKVKKENRSTAMWQQLSKFVAAAVAHFCTRKYFSVHISLSSGLPSLVLSCLVFPFRGWAEQLCKYLRASKGKNASKLLGCD